MAVSYSIAWSERASNLLEIIGGMLALRKIGAYAVNVDDDGLDFFFNEVSSGANYVRLLSDGLDNNHALFYHIDHRTHAPKHICSARNMGDTTLAQYFREETS